MTSTHQNEPELARKTLLKVAIMNRIALCLSAIVRNYENAILKAGGKVLNSKPDWWVNGKILKDGQEAWAQVERGNGQIWLSCDTTPEMRPMTKPGRASCSCGEPRVSGEWWSFRQLAAAIQISPTPTVVSVIRALAARQN